MTISILRLINLKIKSNFDYQSLTITNKLLSDFTNIFESAKYTLWAQQHIILLLTPSLGTFIPKPHNTAHYIIFIHINIIYYINFNTMTQPFCITCKKSQHQQLISLICDHVLCLTCAETLKTIEGHSNIQNKFRIPCPSCKKGTVTYDVKNLLLNQHSDNLMFENIEDSELNESFLAEEQQRPNSQHQNLKEMSYSQRVNNLSRKESRTPDVCFEWRDSKNRVNYDSNRASKNGNREQDYASICKQHSQNLIFFCEPERKLLCMQCMYKHTKDHKNHKVLSIKNSVNLISKENLIFKEQTKKKMDQLEEYIRISHHNKTILEETFKSSLQIVQEEFAAIERLLKSRQAMVRESLKNLFTMKDKELNTQIADLTHLQNCLKQYMTFQLEGTSSEVYFFHAYSLLRQAMSKLSLKVHPISPSSINLIDRIDPIEIKTAIQRLFQMHKERRPESRVDSAHPKHSSMLNQEIKNAKKKLQKLQKLGKGEKANHYLNNYMSNYQREKQFQRERKSVQVQNQRRSHNKVITPSRVSSKVKHKK